MGSNTSPLRQTFTPDRAEDLFEPTDAPFGNVYPGPPGPPMPDRDARTYALEVMRQYISRLEFHRTGGAGSGGKSIAFRIPEEDIHIYQPDAVDNQPRAPSFGILPGRGTHEPYGLGPPRELDDTRDVFCPGYVLILRGDYIETVGLEIWSSEQAERRAIIAGLQTALRISQNSSALRLRCENYFNRIAIFNLMESEIIEDDPVAQGRRRAHVYVQLTIQEVTLVRYRNLHVDYRREVTKG